MFTHQWTEAGETGLHGINVTKLVERGNKPDPDNVTNLDRLVGVKTALEVIQSVKDVLLTRVPVNSASTTLSAKGNYTPLKLNGLTIFKIRK